MNKRHVITLVMMFFIVVTGVIFVVNNYNPEDELLLQDVMQDDVIESSQEILDDSKDTKNSEKNLENSEANRDIYIHVCGAVSTPGVYKLRSGARVVDAIKIAGGFTNKADTVSVNQAKELVDSEQIYIPKQGEIKKELAATIDSSSKTSDDKKVSNKVNINLASLEELITLPGVGEAKAQKIIDYRKRNGSFSKIEDIMKITGIKEGLFKKISEYITI